MQHSNVCRYFNVFNIARAWLWAPESWCGGVAPLPLELVD